VLTELIELISKFVRNEAKVDVVISWDQERMPVTKWGNVNY
jgi:hypothetical protein